MNSEESFLSRPGECEEPVRRSLSREIEVALIRKLALYRITFRCLSIFWLAAVSVLASPADAQQVNPTGTLRVEGAVAGKKAGKPGKDLSGIACMQPSKSRGLVCMTVNDENQSAQFVSVMEDTLVVGKELKLIGGDDRTDAVGVAPQVSCPSGRAEFAEFDGEGVAYAKPHFCVVGSHGCSRKSKQFRLSSFYLARVAVDDEGRPVGGKGRVERSYRLSDALRRAVGVSEFFGKDLMSENGLNIEGIAVRDGWLVVGLRAPALKGNAFLVRVRVDDVFAPGNKPLTSDPQVLALSLGPDRGIRDLAFLPDGRLLVLAGPAQDQSTPYSLFVTGPRLENAQSLGDLAPVLDSEGDPAKAEAVTLLAIDGREAVVLVLFDGLKNGGPRKYRVPL